MTITEILGSLKRSMHEDHVAVNQVKNPVALRLNDLTGKQLEYIIAQYSTFPRRIVEFLYAARDSAREKGWSAIDAELTRNMGEELGTETDGVSHYEMLVGGIAEATETSMYKKLKGLAPSQATKIFLDKVKLAVSHSETACALGATYALESSAVPELIIVKDILTTLFKKTGQGAIRGELKIFFNKHLQDWEPGHEAGLYRGIPLYLNTPEMVLFSEGFESVMAAMDTWWTELCGEATRLSA